MKNILLILIIVFACQMISVAQSVSYQYDAAGNRISRTTITLKSISGEDLKSVSDTEEEMAEEADPGLEDIWNQRKVTIYPNPTKGELQISITGGSNESAYGYELYNSIGTKVLSGEITQLGVNPLSMTACKPGVYFLILVCGDERTTYKIIRE